MSSIARKNHLLANVVIWEWIALNVPRSRRRFSLVFNAIFIESSTIRSELFLNLLKCSKNFDITYFLILEASLAYISPFLLVILTTVSLTPVFGVNNCLRSIWAVLLILVFLNSFK